MFTYVNHWSTGVFASEVLGVINDGLVAILTGFVFYGSIALKNLHYDFPDNAL